MTPDAYKLRIALLAALALVGVVICFLLQLVGIGE